MTRFPSPALVLGLLVGLVRQHYMNRHHHRQPYRSRRFHQCSHRLHRHHGKSRRHLRNHHSLGFEMFHQHHRLSNHHCTTNCSYSIRHKIHRRQHPCHHHRHHQYVLQHHQRIDHNRHQLKMMWDCPHGLYFEFLRSTTTTTCNDERSSRLVENERTTTATTTIGIPCGLNTGTLLTNDDG